MTGKKVFSVPRRAGLAAIPVAFRSAANWVRESDPGLLTRIFASKNAACARGV